MPVKPASDLVAKALHNTLISPNENDRNGEEANVVDGLFAIARALNGVASELRALGNGDAASSMGALESFGMHIGEKLDRLIDKLPDPEER